MWMERGKLSHCLNDQKNFALIPQQQEELSDDEKFETQTVFASEREGYCVIFLIFLVTRHIFFPQGRS